MQIRISFPCTRDKCGGRVFPDGIGPNGELIYRCDHCTREYDENGKLVNPVHPASSELRVRDDSLINGRKLIREKGNPRFQYAKR